MAKKKPPTPVLVVDKMMGLVGVRRSGGQAKMPGGVVVLDATCGHKAIPDNLTPSEIHFHQVGTIGRRQSELINEVVDVLLERAGLIDHAHAPLERETVGMTIRHECRCGARRERPRGPHDWTDWAR